MSLEALPSRPQNNSINEIKDKISDEEFNKRETYIKKYYLETNPRRTKYLGFLRQISGPGYINELGEQSTVDWTNMYISHYRHLKDFKDKSQENFKLVLDNIVSFVMYYRAESETERLPEHLYKKYINDIFEALQ